MVAFTLTMGVFETLPRGLGDQFDEQELLTWDHCKDSSSQVPRSPDVELRASARRVHT